MAQKTQYTSQGLPGRIRVFIAKAGPSRATLSLSLPVYTMQSKAYIGSIPECIVMNTKLNAVSEYLNYYFNSYARFNGKNITADQNGIYEVDETDQDAATYKIKAHIKSGIIDTYTDDINRLRDSYISYKSDGSIQLTSNADKKVTRRYLVHEQTDGISKDIKSRRIKFERGIRNRKFDFKIENIDGSRLEINKFTIHTEPIISKRR